MAEKVAVGVDFGSSHVTAAVVKKNGERFSNIYRRDINPNWPAEKIIETIVQVINRAKAPYVRIDHYQLIGVGVGSPGPLDFETWTLFDTPNLPTLNNVCLGKPVSEKTKLPVIANNDANTYVFGETIYGAGQGCDIVYGCTLGGGFGHGIVINNKILVGAHNMACEMARTPYLEGTIEDYVSGRGLRRRWIQCSGQDIEIPSAAEIANIAKSGEPIKWLEAALKTYRLFGRDLGYAFAWIATILDPDIIIVGGNIAKDFKLFAKETKETLWAALPESTKGVIEVVPGKLQEEATIKGGAALAFQRFG